MAWKSKIKRTIKKRKGVNPPDKGLRKTVTVSFVESITIRTMTRLRILMIKNHCYYPEVTVGSKNEREEGMITVPKRTESYSRMLSKRFSSWNPEDKISLWE